MSAFSLLYTPGSVTITLHCLENAPLPRPSKLGHPELRYSAYRQVFSAQGLSMSKLLRIF